MLSDREAFPKGSISVYCIQPEILMLKRVATATLTLHGVSFSNDRGFYKSAVRNICIYSHLAPVQMLWLPIGSLK